jgi:hypothetical protein
LKFRKKSSPPIPSDCGEIIREGKPIIPCGGR